MRGHALCMRACACLHMQGHHRLHRRLQRDPPAYVARPARPSSSCSSPHEGWGLLLWRLRYLLVPITHGLAPDVLLLGPQRLRE
jgi:hypothetical protein